MIHLLHDYAAAVIAHGQANYNPPAKDLPNNLGQAFSDVIGYAKNICLGLAMVGTLAVAGMLVIGMRGRSDTAKNALSHLPFVVLGVILTGSAWGLIQTFGGGK